MKLRDVIVVRDGNLVAGTWFIAQGFQREHKDVLKIIRKYAGRFETLGELCPHKFKSTGGRPVTEYWLNEPQATFLGTLFKNQNDIVVDFKLGLVKEFYRMKSAILHAKAQHADAAWIETRVEGKVKRLEATDRMKEFKLYAEMQGSEHADKYYMNISKMMNGMLFIVRGKYKSLRDFMTPRQLMVTSAAEGIIDKALKDGMKKDIYYKEIYKTVRARVELFAELHGKSEVISKQLSLPFEQDQDD